MAPGPAGNASGEVISVKTKNREDTDLLQFVHKNAEMGVSTIPKVMELVEEPKMRSALDSQLEEYARISSRAKAAIRRRGRRPRSPGPVSEAMSDMMLRCRTAGDRSPSHIAEMMIRGSTMGTVQMVRRIHGCGGDREAVELARQLLKTEESNIQQLKAFL